MTRPAPIIAGSIAALLLLSAAYMGAYYAMLSRLQITFGNPPPVYHNNSDLVRMGLYPAHQFDRLIRPDCWGDSVPLVPKHDPSDLDVPFRQSDFGFDKRP